MYIYSILYFFLSLILVGSIFSKKVRSVTAKIIIGAILFALFFIIGWSL